MPPHPQPRVLLALPAFNEEAALPTVLAEIRTRTPEFDVVVINDGSVDGTVGAARRAGADVIDLPFNLGVGGAMRTAFKFGRDQGYDVVVQVDADGQHDPAEIGALVTALQESGADVMIGARFAGAGDYEVRGPRRWAMSVLSVVLSRIVGTRLTDTTSGFKACGARAVGVFALEYPAEYLGDTVEALVIASRADLIVQQRAVAMLPRAAGVPSHGPFRAALFLVRAVSATALALMRPTATRSTPEGTAL